MDPIRIRQAIREVRELRSTILEKQLYQGYSGRARIVGGVFALVGSLMMLWFRGNEELLFAAWGTVFVLAALVNYGAILSWHFKKHSKDYRKLAPMLEAFPVWIVAGVLTLALFVHHQADLLYGMWMALFAIVQGTERSRLPRDLVWVGIYYLCAGIYFLLNSQGTFEHPEIMGAVFFVGEFGAGVLLHLRGQKHSTDSLSN